MRPRAWTVLCAVAATGCYHYTFEQEPARTTLTAAGRAPERERTTVTYERSVPTYLNGFVGNGVIDTRELCERPIRTELRVTATDVLISTATLLVFTPHTLSVTCER